MNPQSWVGQTLNNRYQIDRLLGQGGMSTVYRGHDPNLDRPVAIKIIHTFLVMHQKFVQRFQREAAAVARLRHSNIVQVYDFNQIDGTYYMVMEFVEGYTLQDTIQMIRSGEGSPLPLPDLIHKMEKLAAAIGYAHQQGLIHRDLKPANVMVRSDGELLLMDFGIAKVVDTSQNITSTGAVMGTVSYMAPEQVKGEEIDGRADLYAFGVILYELMTGRRPFEGETTFQTMMKHLHDPVPEIQSLYPDGAILDALTEVVYRLLAKDPNNRFHTAADLALALSQCRLAEVHTAATRLDLPSPQESAPPLVHHRPQTPQHQRRQADEQIATLESSLVKDPLKEDALAELLDLQARRGDFLAALKRFNAYKKELDQELGIEPMPETVQLREKIMSARLAPWNNLKPDITPFVGRSQEIDRLMAMILDDGIRLLTITGSGGMGKTRLARRMIRQLGSHEWRYFLHGVFYVPLAMVDQPAEIIYAVAAACDLVLSGQEDPLDQLAKGLRARETLLVLDNFEHLTEHAPLIFTLLQNAPHCKVMVTSRHRLNLPGETVFPLTGLAYSPFDDSFDVTAELDDGPRLFLQASRKLNPNFSLDQNDHFSIFRICEIVDGIPLGIELAASWTRVLACHEIVERLETDLNLLTNDQTPVTERHRDLQAVFQYSWDLLSEEERSILAALSIFRGPFEFQAAEQVAGASAEVTAGLVDKSLLQAVELHDATQAVHGRLYSVHEIVRYYARQKLAADPAREKAISLAHADVYAAYVRERHEPLRSGAQRQAWEEIQRNFSNIRLAWQSGLENGRFDLVGGMVNPIYRYFLMGGLILEGHLFFEDAIGRLPLNPPFELYHRLHGRLAGFNIRLARYDEVERVCSGCVASWQEHDPDSIESKREQAFLLHLNAEMDLKQGNFEEALAHNSEAEALHRAIDAPAGLAGTVGQKGVIAYLQGDYMQAYLHYEDALNRYRTIGDEVNAARVQANLALFQIAIKQFDEGKKGLQADLEIGRRWQNRQKIATTLLNLAFANISLELYDEARTQIEESLLHYREAGDREGEATALLLQGQIEWDSGQKSTARRILFKGLNLALKIGATPKALEFLATLVVLLIDEEEFGRAWQILRFVDTHPQANQMAHTRAQALLAQVEEKLSPDKIADREQAIASLTVAGLAAMMQERFH